MGLSYQMLFHKFTFQVQVTKGLNNGGIVFRSTPDGKLYYKLMVCRWKMSESSFLWLGTERSNSFLFKDLSLDGHTPVLLAIVVQDNALDVYCNLEHLGRIFDTTYLMPGQLGLYTYIHRGQHDSHVVKFSHAKVWIKADGSY